MPRNSSVGIHSVCSLCGFFQDLKSRTAATDTPLFFFYVAKKLKCFIPVRVFDGKKKKNDGWYLFNSQFGDSVCC